MKMNISQTLKDKGKKEEKNILPVNKDSINSGHHSTQGEQEIPPCFIFFSIEHTWSCTHASSDSK
jgi:hypothetical protein